METCKNFGIVINHPAFGRIKSEAKFDGENVEFGEGAHTVRLHISYAIKRDMKRFEEMNEGLKPTDKDYIDISTMELFDVNVDGHFVSLRYVFEENWYDGKKCGGRCANGDMYKWYQSGDDKRLFNVSRPVFGVDAFVAW